MATESQRHRRSCRGKPRKTTASKEEEPRPAGPTTVHDVPDHVLSLVLLCLDSSLSLLRAAAACKLWRRTIAGSGFLTRFRTLHAPCVADHYHAFDPDWVEYGAPPITGNPVFVPCSSSNNSAVVDSSRFSLDFLPDSDSGWAVADSRGSLLLLFKRRTGWAARAQSHCFPDLVVCDPLTRRCQGILRPEGVAYCLGVFLIDGDRDHAEGSAGGGVANFRVVSVLHEYFESSEPEGCYKPVACVFSPGDDDGGWRGLPSASTNSDGVTLLGAMESITFAGRVKGALYWVSGEDGAMLVLDEATTAFWRITFPADTVGGSYDKWSFRVIGSGGGEGGSTLRVVRVINNDLKIFARRRLQGCDDDEWLIEKSLRLPEAAGELPGREECWYFQRNAMIVAAHESYILVTPQEKTCLFSVELETMEVERKHERNRYPGPAYPCELPWPPALDACAAADHGGRRRHR